MLLMFAVALAVAAIPEALWFPFVTIVQAMGTRKMAKEHAVIKDLRQGKPWLCVCGSVLTKRGRWTQNRAV